MIYLICLPTNTGATQTVRKSRTNGSNKINIKRKGISQVTKKDVWHFTMIHPKYNLRQTICKLLMCNAAQYRDRCLGRRGGGEEVSSKQTFLSV